MRYITLIVVTLFIVASINYVAPFLIQQSLQNQASKALNTEIAVGSVDFAFTGVIVINAIEVRNTYGYDLPNLLEVDSVYIDLRMMSLFSDTTHINEVIIDDPVWYVEQKISGNNILDFYNLLARGPSDSQAGFYSAGGSEANNVIIDHLYFGESEVQFHALGSMPTAHLPAVELSGIGTDDDLLVEQAMAQVIEQVINAVILPKVQD